MLLLVFPVDNLKMTFRRDPEVRLMKLNGNIVVIDDARTYNLM